jgi:hypothetical protein
MSKHKHTAGIVSLLTLMAVLGPASPAAAGGVSFTLVPRGESAEVVRQGLTIYGIARDLRNRGRIKQRGIGNDAAINQRGRGNTAFLLQRGKGNSGTITQNGNYNGLGLLQFGRKNRANAVQMGDGNLGITLQGRW